MLRQGDNMKPMKIIIKIRNDLAIEWSRENPVLMAGEIGVEKDTGKIKFGDGIHKWDLLPYNNGKLDIEKLAGAYECVINYPRLK